MLPLFPFIVGLAVGSAAIGLYRNKSTQDNLKNATSKLKEKSTQAQETLRHAAVSGLNMIESSSARLRDRLQADPEMPDVTPAKKSVSRTRKRSTSKPATKNRKANT